MIKGIYTKKQVYEMMKSDEHISSNSTYMELIEKEIENLAKKSNASKKPTAQQLANNDIKEAVLADMAENPDKMYTITDIIKDAEKCGDLTNQRVSALVNQMVAEGAVEKIVDKRKSYFKYIKVED